MVGKSQSAQRQVEFRCQQQDKQAVLQGKGTIQQAEADHHCDYGGTDSGEEFQGKGGHKGHPQNRHGYAAVLFRGPGQQLCLPFGSAKDLQIRQTLHQIQQVAGQTGKLIKLTAVERFAPFADQHHQQRDKRR